MYRIEFFTQTQNPRFLGVKRYQWIIYLLLSMNNLLWSDMHLKILQMLSLGLSSQFFSICSSIWVLSLSLNILQISCKFHYLIWKII